jgi:hypothetical protein
MTIKNRFEVLDSMETAIATADTLRDAIYFVHKWNSEHEFEDTFLIYDDHEKKVVGVYW